MRRIIAFSIITFIACSLFCRNAIAREVSKAGEIFQQSKNGVVTVLAAGHGSGFLMDSAGLIVTNCHVVNDSGDKVRVRFGPGEVVEALVLKKDRIQDVAILWVNLKNIKHPTVLEAFIPPVNEPLVMVGEKVVAIGSPIKWESLEKTMTEGIVSKFENKEIHHDATINGGNSGGPLLNYDGKVVGMNTFSTINPSRGGAGISGAVNILNALPILDEAKKLLAKQTTTPEAKLFPDLAVVNYPPELLQKTTKGDYKPHRIATNNYEIFIETPGIQYRRLQQAEKKLLEKRTSRGKQKGFELSDDEKESLNQFTAYHSLKPVVNISVIPKPKITNGSILKKVIAIGVAGVFAAPIVATKNNYEYRRDFQSMKLVNALTGAVICDSLVESRVPFTKDVAYSYLDFYYQRHRYQLRDKSYAGIYEYDSKCFDHTQPLRVVIESQGDDPVQGATVTDDIKKTIRGDFKPFWDFLSQSSATNAAPKPVPVLPPSVTPPPVAGPTTL